MRRRNRSQSQSQSQSQLKSKEFLGALKFASRQVSLLILFLCRFSNCKLLKKCLLVSFALTTTDTRRRRGSCYERGPR